MITRSTSELHFANSRDPLPTVEVQAKSLEAQGLVLSQVVSSSLIRFATKNPTCKATIYMYGTISVNFHEPDWSEFLIVAGDKRVLKAIEIAFSNLPGVKSRYSDYVPPSEGIRAFHLEDGQLWRCLDDATWYSDSPAGEKKDHESVDKPSESTAAVEDDEDNWWSPTSGTEPESSEVDGDDVLQVGRTPEQPARFRAARSDAKVVSIRQSIEQVFGLPEGSVALCGPDGRALRGDAFIKTLRRKWQDA